MKILHTWFKANSVMFINAGSLVATTAVTSVLGFVYWWIAAREFPPETVGFTSAIISAMTLLSSIGILGLGTLLTGEVQRYPGKEMSLINAALILVGVVGGVVGIAFALLAPFISTNFQPLRASIQDILFFAFGVGLTAITLVLDQALIGLLRGELQFWRNTLFAMIKLVALLGVAFWLSHSVGLTIYNTWTLGNVLSLGALAAFVILKRGWSGRRWMPHWGLLGKLRLSALQHHILNLIIQAPSLALPLFVTALLSVKANAWFYIAWMITSFLVVTPQALSTVLYAESASQPARLAHKIRLTVGISFVVCGLSIGVLQLGTKQVLDVFGHAYADQASWCLRILSLSAFPSIIKSYYITLCRIQNRLVQAMLPLIGCGILQLVFVSIGARLAGLPGLSMGWLIALSIEAVCMCSRVYKAAQFTTTFPLEDTANAEGEKQCVS